MLLLITPAIVPQHTSSNTEFWGEYGGCWWLSVTILWNNMLLPLERKWSQRRNQDLLRKRSQRACSLKEDEVKEVRAVLEGAVESTGRDVNVILEMTRET